MLNKDYLKDFNLSFEEQEKFQKYTILLEEWSKKINLTSITKPDEIYIKHYYDSLLLSAFLKNNCKLADIGSGAGFPGIPLKIKCQDVDIDLIEPTTKRCNFLNLVISELKLDKIQVINKRSEELPDKKEYYDVVTSRAVASLNILLELSIPLLKVGGKMYALKGSSFKEEIEESANALKTLKCKVTNIYEFDLPESMGHRSIIEIEKLKSTPQIYPRLYSKIKKQPL